MYIKLPRKYTEELTLSLKNQSYCHVTSQSQSNVKFD